MVDALAAAVTSAAAAAAAAAVGVLYDVADVQPVWDKVSQVVALEWAAVGIDHQLPVPLTLLLLLLLRVLLQGICKFTAAAAILLQLIGVCLLSSFCAKLGQGLASAAADATSSWQAGCGSSCNAACCFC
jgi:hypothetical protein